VNLAVESLQHLPTEAVLRVVGGGDERELRRLTELSRRLGLDPRVTFEQRQRSELAAIYAGADVVVFPVLWEEPWGIVPLEAMAVGRPVVASGRGGTAEYLRDGANAVLFSPEGGGRALAQGVLRVAHDSGLRERLRVGGLETAARFTESGYNDAIEHGLRRALRRRS
jgi:glycosyltransferase involved in cell wall biosynthesis